MTLFLLHPLSQKSNQVQIQSRFIRQHLHIEMGARGKRKPPQVTFNSPATKSSKYRQFLQPGLYPYPRCDQDSWGGSSGHSAADSEAVGFLPNMTAAIKYRQAHLTFIQHQEYEGQCQGKRTPSGRNGGCFYDIPPPRASNTKVNTRDIQWPEWGAFIYVHRHMGMAPLSRRNLEANTKGNGREQCSSFLLMSRIDPALNGSIETTQPTWGTNLLDQYIKTINVLSKYNNILVFNVSNEVLTTDATKAMPFLKAAAWDMKAYLTSISSSALVGYIRGHRQRIVFPRRLLCLPLVRPERRGQG
ncbi:hypothetical protein B0H14DRAFT_2563352 [Mycena olivaceomarginata]|nr:hypothetical protein B0H14DRAFT_2563352 [Mycena olivaceomarginata]